MILFILIIVFIAFSRERAEERLREHIIRFEKKLEDLQKDVDQFKRKDVRGIQFFKSRSYFS